MKIKFLIFRNVSGYLNECEIKQFATKSLSFQNQISYIMRNSNSKDFKNVFDGKFKIRKPQILNFRNSDSYKFKILVVCISLPPHAT